MDADDSCESANVPLNVSCDAVSIKVCFHHFILYYIPILRRFEKLPIPFGRWMDREKGEWGGFEVVI